MATNINITLNVEGGSIDPTDLRQLQNAIESARTSPEKKHVGSHQIDPYVIGIVVNGPIPAMTIDMSGPNDLWKPGEGELTVLHRAPDGTDPLNVIECFQETELAKQKVLNFRDEALADGTVVHAEWHRQSGKYHVKPISASTVAYLQITGTGFNVAQPFTDTLLYWTAKLVTLELNTTTFDWNVTQGGDVLAVSLRDSGRSLPQKGEIYRANLVSADGSIGSGLPVYEIVPDSHANWYVESTQIVQVAFNPGGQTAYLPFQLNDAHLGNGGNAAYGDIQRGWTNGTQPDEITCRRGGGWWFNLEFLMEIGSAVSVDITMFWELNTVRVGERVFKLRPGAAAVSTSLTHQLMRDFEIGDDLRFGIVQTQSSTISTNDVTYFTCHGMPM